MSIDLKNPELKPTRDGFGLGLVEAGEKDERVVVLSADLTESTRTQWFKDKFPDRFIELGVAEQNMATVASGLANYGKIPFIASYAAFSPGRNWEQLRTTVCINNVPVKIGGMHAGVSVGPDGGTHQQLEDIAIMRAMPRMVVVVPCDAVEGQKATFAAAFSASWRSQPTYLRFGREKSPIITTPETPFEIGKAIVMRKGKDISIIACGILVYQALIAAEVLASEGIECEIINSHTIKPLDQETIIASASKTGAVVTVEEHQITGGLGGAVAECLARNHPTPQEFVGMPDRFGESGTPDELIKHFGLDATGIQTAVHKVLSRKNK